MAETHIISRLVAKYAELSGRLKACEQEARNLKEALSYLNHTIHIFKPDYQVGQIMPKRTHRRHRRDFAKGNYIRTAMDILREAKEPLSARDIARMVLERHGVSEPDNKTLEDIRRGLNGGLTQRVKKGTVAVHKEYFPKRFSWVSK